MAIRLFIITCFGILIMGCKGTLCPLHCRDLAYFHLVGYDSTALDSVVIKAFTDNSYTNEVSSTVYNYSKSRSTFSDTMLVYEYGMYALSDSVYNFEIIVPSANKTYKISEVQYTGSLSNDFKVYGEEECNEYPRSCFRTLSSYKLDGNTMTNGENIYLQK